MTMPSLPGARIAGAVDLSALRKPAPASTQAAAAPATHPQVLEADIALISELIPTTVEVPLVVELTSPRADGGEELHADLVTAVGETAGRVRLARVNVDENPQAVQAFQLQSLPTVVAVVAGKSLPVFEGVHPLEQLRDVMTQIVALADREGVRGVVTDAATAASAEPAAQPLPPLHQAAHDALEQGDFEAAATAYKQALLEAPSDSEAKIGLARVGLFQRTAGVALTDARDAAAAAPHSVAAQMLAADMDVLGGHIEDAFLRLIDLVKAQVPADRGLVRDRLLELFEVVGATDERVMVARRQLANALF